MMIVENEEKVSNLLAKDGKGVLKKYAYVLSSDCYRNNGQDLVKWDFIGPFFISIVFSVYDSLPINNVHRSVYPPWKKEAWDDHNNAFILFFLTLWIGPFICGISASFLGCYVHWLSVTSVVMYLLLPLCLSSVLCLPLPFIVRFFLIPPSFLYSSAVLYRFLRTQTFEHKHFLCFQPVFLFYSIFSMLAVLN